MTAVRALLVLALGTMLMSGCAGRNASDVTEVSVSPPGPRPDDELPSEVPVAAPTGEIILHRLTGHFAADALYLGGIQSPNSSLYFDVLTNATALVVELQWTGATSDFALAVFTPRACKPGPTDVALVNSVACQANWMAAMESDGIIIRDRAIGSSGPGAIRIDFAKEAIESEPCGQDVCLWRAVARDNVAVDSDFDLRASVFHDLAIPEDYTAFVEP